MAPTDRSNLVVKLQILAAVGLPLMLLVVWLGSRGFFDAVPGS